MQQDEFVEKTIVFVKEKLSGAEGGHDWWHIERVWKTAVRIGRQEGSLNMQVVELAALLHDIADSKFHGGDEEIGPATARLFMDSIGIEEDVAFHVELIIRNMSFKSSLEETLFNSPEMEVVQDADRLDAIGAIGIARAFTYGGHKNRLLYDPSSQPRLNMSKEEYKQATSPTINHFYEKLLLLKDKMNTQTARAIAEERHKYMESYLQQFYAEWDARR